MIAITVDDERPMLEQLSQAVKVSPDVSSVLEFTTCTEALEWVEKNHVDIAFLDISMRGMGGMALAEKLLKLRPRCKIIFCTGYSEYAVDAFQLHVSGYLMKPITAEAVQREIDEAVSLSNRKNTRAYIRHYGHVERNNIRPMKYRFTKLLTDASACRTYAELDKLLEGFDFLELDCRTCLPDSFITPFVNAGAFYTLKNAIMFENKRIYRNDCAGSLKLLTDAARRSPNGAMELYRYNA